MADGFFIVSVSSKDEGGLEMNFRGSVFCSGVTVCLFFRVLWVLQAVNKAAKKMTRDNLAITVLKFFFIYPNIVLKVKKIVVRRRFLIK